MTIDDLLRWAVPRLGAPREGLPDPAREARWLLSRAMGVGEAWLLGHREEPPGAAVEATFRAWVERRRRGEPAHHLIGSCPFWGREFVVSPAVLIPRPETELLVATALTLALPPAPRVLDVGTGSGCLAVTIAAEWPRAVVVASDLSLPALAVARANIRRHGVEVRLLAGDLTAALAGPFDLVVANLPYIPEGDLPNLPPEVRDREPRLALAGGADGADLLRRLVAELPRVLGREGHALLEIGPGQAELLAPHWSGAGLARAALHPDATGIPRLLHLRRTGR
ncbi:MAG: peptide chain release factor N(5)-glutamine methyltransferase [Acidobacteriota bacterium]|jgi:release factor glutamine methyltransferase